MKGRGRGGEGGEGGFILVRHVGTPRLPHMVSITTTEGSRLMYGSSFHTKMQPTILVRWPMALPQLSLEVRSARI